MIFFQAGSPAPVSSPEQGGGGAPVGEPEPMSEKSIREARSVIDVFDVPLVGCYYYQSARTKCFLHLVVASMNFLFSLKFRQDSLS